LQSIKSRLWFYVIFMITTIFNQNWIIIKNVCKVNIRISFYQQKLSIQMINHLPGGYKTKILIGDLLWLSMTKDHFHINVCLDIFSNLRFFKYAMFTELWYKEIHFYSREIFPQSWKSIMLNFKTIHLGKSKNTH
jgi:hypothetical protein